MKIKFKVENINCESCANLIKNGLENDFGIINIDMNVEPKELSLEIKDENTKEYFVKELESLGFNVIGEINE